MVGTSSARLPVVPMGGDGVKDRRLRWLLGSSALSNLGDGIGKVAFPLLAASITRDPILIAGLSATAFLPWLLFATVSGALVDRVDRRRAMLIANLSRAVIVGGLGLLVLADATTIWLLYVMALLLGAVETVADNAAQALVPAVVPRDQLESANGKLQSVEIVGQTFLGGPLGSLTFAVFAAMPFLLNSAGFAIAAVLLIGINGRFRPVVTGPTQSLRVQLGEGVRWLRGNALMVRLAVFAATMALATELAQALLVLYALQDIHLSEATFGVFALVGGAGGIIGAFTAPRLTRALSRRTVLVGSIVCCGLAFTAMSVSKDPVTASLLFGGFAAAVVVVNVILGSLRHALVPDHLFGRVLGVWRTAVWGAIPVGALLGGLLATWLGTRAVFAISGVLQLALAAAVWFALAGHRGEVDSMSTAGTP
ncbi:Predicted arabinose efflux permease, MFS family [Actinokineospora alba]|uniref:Predicted arabinose efflux permease, MFS family n=2 Tax=Actinokineospora alba TaxID=504798 RepID=A0A1H0WLD9_9PSEU|nr:putative MFS family arabinose efflux permease [Actinokineospora alba]SDJ44060.1 Predicted arabinose efflux permease, MFS family [Actinokineospora alba]SDP91487.1 Predicted arabinose efflux permease, MFS family [Actinokineospora alba]